MRIIVRTISDSFVDAIARDPRPINVTKARKQHAAYVNALRSLGAEIIELPADEEYPDGVFVEDQAVVHEGHALVTRSGHPARIGEALAVKGALTTLGLTIHEVQAPGTLDGGDVLRVGSTLYVGRSGRTNSQGMLSLMGVFGACGLGIVPIDVPNNYLHLKSICSSPLEGLVLVAPDTVDPGRFEAPHIIVVTAQEAHACNAVGIDRTVLIPGGCPTTAAALTERGYDVIEVGTSEIRKADGALTCCSIFVA